METQGKGIKVSRKDVGLVIESLLSFNVKRATKYLRPDFVISAQRKVWGGKPDFRDKSVEVVLKIGRPNFAEKEFIKQCKKAGEPFPVKGVQFKLFPIKLKRKRVLQINNFVSGASCNDELTRLYS